MKSKLSSFLSGLLILLCLLAVACASSAPPNLPIWPVQFHVSVKIANAAAAPSSQLNSIGQYYYDYDNKQAAFILQDVLTQIANRTLVLGSTSTVTTYAESSGKCTSSPLPTELPQFLSEYVLFSPDFLSFFTYVSIDWIYRSLSYHRTYHYQYISDTNQIDYYHDTDNDIPFRLQIGPNAANSLYLFNPIILEFQGDFHLGFDDLTAAGVETIFNIPETVCAVTTKPIHGFSKQLLRSIRAVHSNPDNKIAPVATPWPDQFNCKTAFTGNDFGKEYTVNVQLVGNFYFDSLNNRECNIWTDLTNGEKTKTIIVNGAFHAIAYSSGACVEPPVPITGSLHPNWTLSTKYLDVQYLLREGDFFLQSQHFAWDAFNSSSLEYSFQYWQLPSGGEPLQFQGPINDVAPYYTSFNQYSEFVTGLQGLNSTDIYSTPAKCQKLGMDEWNAIINDTYEGEVVPGITADYLKLLLSAHHIPIKIRT